MPKTVESTSEAFAGWVEKLDPDLGEKDFASMMDMVLESCFGQRTVREVDVLWMRRKYLAALSRIRKPKKPKKAV
jgi:hypothetical protein